jgi:cation diffusion facilitator CzcD-associated flavoprotein CzcO
MAKPAVDVAVIGAGPHGVTIGAALAERLGSGAVCLLDPHDAPLAAWSSRARAIGMRDMRSPWVHHCGRQPDDLYQFAGTSASRAGRTPPVAVFEAHALDRAERAGLVHRATWVAMMTPHAGSWRLLLHGGETLDADRVVVATGLAPHRRHRLGGRPLPDSPVTSHGGRVAVIGAGHTGASAALHMLSAGGRVDLFGGRGLREQDSDVDPGWFGPKYLRSFTAAAPERRRQRLREARFGTTTADVARRLRARRACGHFRLVTGRVTALAGPPAERTVRTAAGEDHGPYEMVYEAPGYEVSLHQEPLLAGLSIPECGGLPVLDAHLQALPGLHLVGPLAELELGPAGRNLWGAMHAARRIAASLETPAGQRHHRCARIEPEHTP